VLGEVKPTTKHAREEWVFWIAFWGRATRNPQLASSQKRRHRAFRSVIVHCLEQARGDGELAPRLDLEDEAAAIAALSWGIGVLATFEARALTTNDIERELDARIDRLRARPRRKR